MRLFNTSPSYQVCANQRQIDQFVPNLPFFFFFFCSITQLQFVFAITNSIDCTASTRVFYHNSRLVFFSCVHNFNHVEKEKHFVSKFFFDLADMSYILCNQFDNLQAYTDWTFPFSIKSIFFSVCFSFSIFHRHLSSSSYPYYRYIPKNVNR